MLGPNFPVNGVISNYADWLPYPAEVCGGSMPSDARDAYTVMAPNTLWTGRSSTPGVTPDDMAETRIEVVSDGRATESSSLGWSVNRPERVMNATAFSLTRQRLGKYTFSPTQSIPICLRKE